MDPNKNMKLHVKTHIALHPPPFSRLKSLIKVHLYARLLLKLPPSGPEPHQRTPIHRLSTIAAPLEVWLDPAHQPATNTGS